MRNLTLKTTLSALLVSAPLAGAFAQSDDLRGLPPVDYVYTSSVGSAANTSYAKMLDSSLNAAETNLNAPGRDGLVNPVAASQVRSDIQAVRQAAAQERQANGGDLSGASYQALSGQVRVIHQNVLALQNGG